MIDWYTKLHTDNINWWYIWIGMLFRHTLYCFINFAVFWCKRPTMISTKIHHNRMICFVHLLPKSIFHLSQQSAWGYEHTVTAIYRLPSILTALFEKRFLPLQWHLRTTTKFRNGLTLDLCVCVCVLNFILSILLSFTPLKLSSRFSPCVYNYVDGE